MWGDQSAPLFAVLLRLPPVVEKRGGPGAGYGEEDEPIAGRKLESEAGLPSGLGFGKAAGAVVAASEGGAVPSDMLRSVLFSKDAARESRKLRMIGRVTNFTNFVTRLAKTIGLHTSSEPCVPPI
ncbi:hypothetical protein MRB53_040413 [Persea americana]|nr:hypothetical protein MRB53_040413 [Persea americana]